jgi:hypothetical protein
VAALIADVLGRSTQPQVFPATVQAIAVDVVNNLTGLGAHYDTM